MMSGSLVKCINKGRTMAGWTGVCLSGGIVAHSTSTPTGCGQTFSLDTNTSTSCNHHPGAPIFHEGLKGYSCCTRRVIEFDAFLTLPGCAVGAHCEVAAPPTPVHPEASKVSPPSNITQPSTSDAFIPTSMPDPKTKVVSEANLQDAPDAIIPPGTTCRRKGCGHVYPTQTHGSSISECTYHPGVPIFHEGSKGWSCCSRKVLEFDEFLKIKGCTTGVHRYTDGLSSCDGAGAVKMVECRHDWYQTQSTIMLSVFGKGIDAGKTVVRFAERQLTIEGVFKNGDVFTFDKPLFQPIDPISSSYIVLSTKLELTLKKGNGLSWPSLEPCENVISFTTFGTHGQTGTVGGKQAIVAADSVVDFLKK